MARVLVVDDEVLFRSLIVEALCLEGHDVLEAHDVESALRTLNHAGMNIDVMLCDLRMNGSDSIALLETVEARYPKIEVVVISAHTRDDGIGRRALSHARYYLAKPFSVSKLLALIQTITSETARST